jgi:hypothetical protein
MKKISQQELDFYTDVMMIQSLFSYEGLSKTAGVEDVAKELIDKVKGYFGSKFDSNNKIASVLNMLAPGAIMMFLSALGMPWIGALVGVAMDVFDVDLKPIFSTILSGVSGLISGDKKTSSAAVDSVVSDAVNSNVKPTSEQEAEAILSKADQPEQISQSSVIRKSRMLKLALIDYELSKNAGIAGAAGKLIAQKTGIISTLGKILSWIVKIILASAGLMVVGDIINKYVLGNDKKDPTSPAAPKSAPVAPKTTQKKFPLQPNYVDTDKSGKWKLSIPNNEDSISNMLVGFAKKVYQGLDGLENIIKNTIGFNEIKDMIVSYNQASQGDYLVFIPANFKSEKFITDFFIDEVAENSK